MFFSCSNLVWEIHILAYKYHWDYFTCLKMTVSTRKEYVEMLKKQIEAENKSIEESAREKGDIDNDKYREGA